MANKSYSDEEQAELVTLAQEIGITRAIKELGYPSYITALRWCRQHGVNLELVDPLKLKAQQTREWYKEEEKRAVCQQGLERVFEVLSTKEVNPDALTADDIKKLADATKRLIEAMALVDGKPTSITQENAQDDAFTAMLEEFNNASNNSHVSSRDLEHEEER